jgi:hypothetical protein
MIGGRTGIDAGRPRVTDSCPAMRVDGDAETTAPGAHLDMTAVEAPTGPGDAGSDPGGSSHPLRFL